jgi:hypothetical protein
MPTLPEIMYPARMNPNLAAQGRNYLANMIPPESVMDPRYAAWKKAQDDAEALGIISDIALTAIPFAGFAAKGAMAAGRTLAPTAGMAAESYMNKIGGLIPLDVYHGTPHRFPPTAKNPLGEFDPTKIGTGEGAQAYGHGLYLAENPAVANEYRRTLRDMNPSYDGAPISNADTVKKTAAELLMKAKGDKAAAIKDAQNYAFDNLLIPEINKINASNVSYGQLYKVDLPNEQIAKMLDWDKPLSQQPESARLALSKFADSLDVDNPGHLRIMSKLDNPSTQNVKFGDLYNEISGALWGRGDKGEFSKQLAEAGIPGIRYLDEGSRGAKTGTRNFVVFPGNENILKILQRE